VGEFVVIGKRGDKKVELLESETLDGLSEEFKTYDDFDNFKLVYREGYTDHRLFARMTIDEFMKSLQEKAGNG